MIKPIKHKKNSIFEVLILFSIILYVTVKKRMCKSIFWRIP